MSRKIFKEIMATTIPSFLTNITSSRTSTDFWKVKDTEKILKGARGKQCIPKQGTAIRLIAYLSDTMELRRQWADTEDQNT